MLSIRLRDENKEVGSKTLLEDGRRQGHVPQGRGASFARPQAAETKAAVDEKRRAEQVRSETNRPAAAAIEKLREIRCQEPPMHRHPANADETD